MSSQWPMLVLIPTGHNFSSALPKPIGWIQSTSFSGMFLKVIYRYSNKIRNYAENGILINIFLGMEVVRLMEKDGSESGTTKHLIVIKDCGELE